jgi:hypothetical protein
MIETRDAERYIGPGRGYVDVASNITETAGGEGGLGVESGYDLAPMVCAGL